MILVGRSATEVAVNDGVLGRFALTERRALVTGASRGLGRAFATALAEAGADVAMVARGHAEVSEAAQAVSASTGRRAVGITADVTVRADVERMISETASQLGGLDILVNNAGICFRQALDVPDSESGTGSSTPTSSACGPRAPRRPGRWRRRAAA